MSMQLVLACVLAALAGYLCGSVVFGILISKVFCHDDVRTHGSGSAGMTNMLRTYGAAAGAATAIGDVAKGAVAVFIGEWLFAQLVPNLDPACGAYLAAIFAAIGHMKPAWFGFKGGKGVLVCGGRNFSAAAARLCAAACHFPDRICHYSHCFAWQYHSGRAVPDPDRLLLGLAGGQRADCCVHRGMQRVDGGDGYLYAPFQHPAPA